MSQAPLPPASRTLREVHYRVDAPVRGDFPGHHRSLRGESGFEFRGHVALLDAPDPRRLDLQASLRDPFGDWRVRVYRQRNAVPVVVVADLSASMGFEGAQRRIGVLADLVDSLSHSAWRTGDSFGFIGCDSEVQPQWLRLPSRAQGTGAALAGELRSLQPAGAVARGLLAAGRHLGRQRALVFLVSDFHLPPALLAQVLDGLSLHEVVPTVLWDAQEFDLGPRQGLARLRDPEHGTQRLVWWRPALRQRWGAAQAAQRETLAQLFRHRRLRPLFIPGAYDAEAVTRHFMA